MKIVFIGAGNLATCVSLEMQRAGMTIGQVYSRTPDSAETLGKKLNCLFTSKLEEIVEDADLYIFSLKDTALPEVISKMKPNNGLWVHTAGSVPMSVFEGYTKRYGVFYPMQTFTKIRRVAMEKTPIFLETSIEEDGKILKRIAVALSGNAQFLSSEQRKSLHLAAVYACNFTNHMYFLASKILEESGVSYEALLPLIDETAAKVHDVHPREAQTGPAVRFDRGVMENHLSMLNDPSMRTIYQLISQNIYKESLDYEQY